MKVPDQVMLFFVERPGPQLRPALPGHQTFLQ